MGAAHSLCNNKWTHVLTMSLRLPRVEEDGLHPLHPQALPLSNPNAAAA